MQAEEPAQNERPGQNEQLGHSSEASNGSRWVPGLIPPFGQVGDFWRRYDTLADKKDKEMLGSLHSNLDVLLIFAGLFSAVNTSFIASTMPGLSPDATSETNALLRLLVMRADNSTLTAADLSPPFSPDSGSVVANCFLYASLCCSLVAAMGAMLGKEWLQSYVQSGQAGPVEEQARFRQQKYTGAQDWHLESTVVFLPNLLLLSVLLFFAGLIVYLWPINATVARVVIALVVSGVLLCCATIVAGAVSPTCPFQTALSRALRPFVELVRRAIRARTTAAEDAVQKKNKQDRDDILNAEAACWLLEATSELQDQLTIAQNLYCLGVRGIRVILASSASFNRLTSLASEATRKMLTRRDETATRLAHEFGTALAYVLRHESDQERLKAVRAEFPIPSSTKIVHISEVNHQE